MIHCNPAPTSQSKISTLNELPNTYASSVCYLSCFTTATQQLGLPAATATEAWVGYIVCLLVHSVHCRADKAGVMFARAWQ